MNNDILAYILCLPITLAMWVLGNLWKQQRELEGEFRRLQAQQPHKRTYAQLVAETRKRQTWPWA